MYHWISLISSALEKHSKVVNERGLSCSIINFYTKIQVTNHVEFSLLLLLLKVPLIFYLHGCNVRHKIV